jgi:hypothetical protein
LFRKNYEAFKLFFVHFKLVSESLSSLALVDFPFFFFEELTNLPVSFSLTHFVKQVAIKPLHDKSMSSYGHVFYKGFGTKESLHDFSVLFQVFGTILYLFNEATVSVHQVHEITINSFLTFFKVAQSMVFT